MGFILVWVVPLRVFSLSLSLTSLSSLFQIYCISLNRIETKSIQYTAGCHAMIASLGLSTAKVAAPEEQYQMKCTIFLSVPIFLLFFFLQPLPFPLSLSTLHPL